MEINESKSTGHLTRACDIIVGDTLGRIVPGGIEVMGEVIACEHYAGEVLVWVAGNPRRIILAPKFIVWVKGQTVSA